MICGPIPIFLHTLIRAPQNWGFSHFGWGILLKSAMTQHHAVFMIPACCPQIWEDMGVMVGAAKIWVGLGPDDTTWEVLKPLT
jgi:hypothetical protein